MASLNERFEDSKKELLEVASFYGLVIRFSPIRQRKLEQIQSSI